jgi:hypothetical protein
MLLLSILLVAFLMLDYHIKHKLLRFRWVPVGEVSGLGIQGHHVKVDKELEVIGLQLYLVANLVT